MFIQVTASSGAYKYPKEFVQTTSPAIIKCRVCAHVVQVSAEMGWQLPIVIKIDC